MQFYSAISERESTEEAAAEVIGQSRQATGGKIDVAFVFFTGHHAEAAPRLLETLWLELDAECVLGCSAEGVIGGTQEIERAPALSLLVGSLPGVRIHPFHITGETAWRGVLSDPADLRDKMGCGPETAAVIAFGDPFTTPMNQLLPAFDAATAGVPLIGGMASSAQSPGDNLLMRNEEIYNSGMVGVSLSGPIAVETIVSQGCRPIGRPMVITKSHGNVIDQLGGQPALSVLRELVAEMTDGEREFLQNGLFVGRAVNEYRERFGRGDFLIRNVVGVDENAGAIAVADYLKIGQTVQFHVRDAATADEDLGMLLDAQRVRDVPASGGLLFSCNGRGTRLFDQPGHDIAAAGRAMPQTPLAGFFAAGELGPIGNQSFMHGHTASFALFRPGKRSKG